MEITSYLLGKKSSGGGGGGTDPQTIGDVNETLQKYLQNTKEIAKEYPSILDTPVTLYTPNESFKTYVIAKAMSGSYRIGWVRDINILKTTNTTEGTGSANALYFSYNINTAELSLSNTTLTWYRGTSTYNSVQSAIDALEDKTTSYESTTFDVPCYGTSPYYLTSTNTAIIINDTTLGQSQRISTKETIEVI